MQNNTAILLPTAFPIINLHAFVNDLLISLSIARVTIVYENRSADIATTLLACKESANIKWYTLNVDHPYKDETYYIGSEGRNYRDHHLVVLAFHASSWLIMFDIQWLLQALKWGWHGSSQYLFVTDNLYDQDDQDEDILELLTGFHSYFKRAALLRYTRSGVVEILKLPDSGQLERIFYTTDTERSVAGSLHHWIFTADQFVDLKGIDFRIFANIYVPNLFPAKLRDNSHKYDENEDMVGGTYVHLAKMIERYFDARVSFVTMDYLEFAPTSKPFQKYIIEELLKVRQADEILPASTNASLPLEMNFFMTLTLKLYPHSFIDYVIIVPSDIKEHLGIGDMLIKSPLFTVWAITVGIITITRMIVRRLFAFNNNFDNRNSNQNAFIYILFNTFGLSFGATSVQGAESRTEKIIVLFLSIFCIVAGILCTGFLLEQIIETKSEQKINSFEQVLFEDDIEQVIVINKLAKEYDLFPREIHKKKIKETYMEYLSYLFSLNIPATAFIIPKEVANTLMVNDKEHFYYMLPKRFGSFQLNFYVSEEMYQQRLNVLFQRLVDQGLIGYFERKVLRDLGVKIEKSSGSFDVDLHFGSVTFTELKFMLVVMLFGMFASILIFIIEIIFALKYSA